MLETYFLFGIVWAIFAGYKRTKLKESQKDHWFSFILFSVLLWPFFTYFAYERGMLNIVKDDDSEKPIGFNM
jgi:hypothetical protein